MLDLANSYVIIAAVGREDRALLKNNPNARPDAGIWTGAFKHRMFLPSLPSSGYKAINLLCCGGATNLEKAHHVHGAVGHMSGNKGRTAVASIGCRLTINCLIGYNPSRILLEVI